MGCVAASLGLVAQTTSIHKNPSKKVFSKSEISPRLVGHQELVSQPIGGGNRTVLLSEDFQGVTLGNAPAAIPSGWTTIAAATATAGQTTPAFKIYNSTLANAGGYWPVPQVGANNKFAGANDDPAPCDCDFLDVWLQTPSMTLTDYEYSANPVDVWGIITNTAVTDVYDDSLFIGFGDVNPFEISAPGSIVWSDIYVNFTSPGGLPVTLDLNGNMFTLESSGSLNLNGIVLGEQLNFVLTTTDGEILSDI